MDISAPGKKWAPGRKPDNISYLTWILDLLFIFAYSYTGCIFPQNCRYVASAYFFWQEILIHWYWFIGWLIDVAESRPFNNKQLLSLRDKTKVIQFENTNQLFDTPLSWWTVRRVRRPADETTGSVSLQTFLVFPFDWTSLTLWKFD